MKEKTETKSSPTIPIEPTAEPNKKELNINNAKIFHIILIVNFKGFFF